MHCAGCHANFYDAGFGIYFHGLQIAKLVAEPFSVRKNSSMEFHYQVESSPVPLDAAAMDYMDATLKEKKIAFNLKGHVRTRWRVGILGSVKFWCDLDCQLQFNPLNRSYIPSYCSSKSK
ncbi:uncharacterized protein LOC131162376 [Malania oleifera]|uniref:uncharacterized protein LOC131162376 n=1 Tax=Malania oleifera TaxID=397392 RepID=UPI0025AEB8C3|nr:uncharacterized protein LOC131162376 [Malania oleifera]